MSNSLLESYIHVFYENKKKVEKSFPKNIFSTDQKKIDRFFFKNIFSEKSKMSKFKGKMLRKIRKMLRKNGLFWKMIFEKSKKSKYWSTEKIFLGKLFSNFFFVFINFMNIATQRATGIYLTPSGRWERAVWSQRVFFSTHVHIWGTSLKTRLIYTVTQYK